MVLTKEVFDEWVEEFMNKPTVPSPQMWYHNGQPVITYWYVDENNMLKNYTVGGGNKLVLF